MLQWKQLQLAQNMFVSVELFAINSLGVLQLKKLQLAQTIYMYIAVEIGTIGLGYAPSS